MLAGNKTAALKRDGGSKNPLSILDLLRDQIP
jgi:hypothetical protein